MSAGTSVVPAPGASRVTRPPDRQPVGLVLYVSLDRAAAAAGEAGQSVAELAETLQEFLRERAPEAETVTALSLSHDRMDDVDLRVARDRLRNAAEDDDGVRMDMAARRLSVDGVEVSLTYREFELLSYLIRHRGRAITRSELMSHVWDVAEPFCDRTVDVHVRRLRGKLGVHGERITTLRGYGYRFDG